MFQNSNLYKLFVSHDDSLILSQRQKHNKRTRDLRTIPYNRFWMSAEIRVHVRYTVVWVGKVSPRFLVLSKNSIHPLSNCLSNVNSEIREMYFDFVQRHFHLLVYSWHRKGHWGEPWHNL